MTALDVAALRAGTPGCDDVVHLNNAGASLVPQRVLGAVASHVALESRLGGYEAADAVVASVGAVYGAIASLVRAAPDDIALMESATRAWQAAVYSVPLADGDRVLIDRASYASSAIAMLHLAKRTGCTVEVIPDDAHGQVDAGAVSSMLDERVRLVSVTHVPSQSGLVNPVEAVGSALRGSDAWYVVDGCQSVGQVDVDVTAIGCDFLSATGRKYLRGPRGTGFLYASSRARAQLDPHVLDLHAATWTAESSYDVRADARRFEVWERSVSAVLGLGAAVDHLVELGAEAVFDRVTDLAARLRTALADVPAVTVQDRGERLAGIVSFTVDGHDAFDVRDRLRAQRINVSATEPATARLDLGGRGLPGIVRASVHAYNTDDELDRLAAALRRLG